MNSASVGRPEIGPAFLIRFPHELIEAVDEAAADQRVSRAGWLRAAATEQLDYPRATLAALAAWMVCEGESAEIGYAIEKPWKFESMTFCAMNQIDGDTHDAAMQRRHQAIARDDELPPGWQLKVTTPIDFQILCHHQHVVNDSGADRNGQPVRRCPHGCTWPLQDDPHSGPTISSVVSVIEETPCVKCDQPIPVGGAASRVGGRNSSGLAHLTCIA